MKKSQKFWIITTLIFIVAFNAYCFTGSHEFWFKILILDPFLFIIDGLVVGVSVYIFIPIFNAWLNK